MMRAAVYARFSTQLQSDQSIDDQVALCRTFAQRQGMEVVRVYHDAAKSGASLHGRDGIRNMMADAVEGLFEVVIVEALDRLSRDMEDMAFIAKRLRHIGVELVGVHDGKADTVTVGLRGLVAQLYREDNAHKVRRGLTGRVMQGLSGGGQSYGYRPDPMRKGAMMIEPNEAAIINRIFEEFREGRSPRQIAYDLNADGVPSPRGRLWNASTINGSAQRSNGILHNEIYNGVRVWNRVTMLKDPDTGNRVSRPNAEKDWVKVEVPELRIVSEELWEATRRKRNGWTLSENAKMRRPKRLLSGLLRCGCCGSGMSTSGSDRSGRVRIRCSAAKESNSCSDPKTFYLDAVEELTLRGLRDQLRRPERLAEYITEYQNEMRELLRNQARDRAKLEANLNTTVKRISTLAMMVADELMTVDDVREEMLTLKEKKASLQAKLAAQPAEPKIVDIIPSAAKAYEKAMADLYRAMDNGIVDPNSDDAAFLRQLVDSVTVYRKPEGEGVEVVVKGYLNALLSQPIDFIGVGIGGSGGGI